MSSVAVAIELSTARGSVAVRSGGRSVERELAGTRAHAADLLPELAAAAAELGATPREVDRVVVGLGPGSYTGLRVAAATALGLARATGAALRGVASVEALAAATLRRGESAGVLMDARAGELYVARYRSETGGLVAALPPSIVTHETLGGALDGVDVLLADDDALRAAALERERFARVEPCRPRALAVLDLGLAELERDGPHEPASIEPLYLRAFAASVRRR